MKFVEAFKKTYRLPGGARAFWLMVLGCVAALVLPMVLDLDGMGGMLIMMVPALLALFFGQQFTATLGQFMMQDSDKEE